MRLDQNIQLFVKPFKPTSKMEGQINCSRCGLKKTYYLKDLYKMKSLNKKDKLKVNKIRNKSKLPDRK